jgi:hypothetical protein
LCHTSAESPSGQMHVHQSWDTPLATTKRLRHVTRRTNIQKAYVSKKIKCLQHASTPLKGILNHVNSYNSNTEICKPYTILYRPYNHIWSSILHLQSFIVPIIIYSHLFMTFRIVSRYSVLVPYFCCKSFRRGASTVRRPLDLPRARAVAKVPRSERHQTIF